nr:immunoglobulin heavy chain junction region [Mus musculus]
CARKINYGSSLYYFDYW